MVLKYWNIKKAEALQELIFSTGLFTFLSFLKNGERQAIFYH
jgi:hypothetical protein